MRASSPRRIRISSCACAYSRCTCSLADSRRGRSERNRCRSIRSAAFMAAPSRWAAGPSVLTGWTSRSRCRVPVVSTRLVSAASPSAAMETLITCPSNPQSSEHGRTTNICASGLGCQHFERTYLFTERSGPRGVSEPTRSPRHDDAPSPLLGDAAELLHVRVERIARPPMLVAADRPTGDAVIVTELVEPRCTRTGVHGPDLVRPHQLLDFGIELPEPPHVIGVRGGRDRVHVGCLRRDRNVSALAPACEPTRFVAFDNNAQRRVIAVARSPSGGTSARCAPPCGATY